MLVRFICKTCRAREAERCKKLDDGANHGKKIWSDKQQTAMNQDNYLREASEIHLLSHGASTNYKVLDYDLDVITGWKCRCTVCGDYTISWIRVGVGDIF